MDEQHRNPVTKVIHGRFTWCAKCNYVHETDQWVELQWHCRHCGAGAGSAQRWVEIAEVQDYPIEPESGRRYPWRGPSMWLT